MGRLEHDTALAVYRLLDAVDCLADRLPQEITARLSQEDARTVLGWRFDCLASVGLATARGQALDDLAGALGDC